MSCRRPLSVCLLLVAAAWLSSARPASAATYTWGNSDTNWNVASNWINNSGLPGSSDVGLFNLNGTYSYQPNLTTAATVGGVWETGSGALTISGSVLTLNGATITSANTGIEMDPGAGALTISSSVALGGAQQWLNNSGNLLSATGGIANGGYLLTVAGSSNTTIAGSLSGGGGLTMSGSGTLALNAANTYTGGTIINGGTVSVGNASAFGGSAVGNGAITINASGTVITGSAFNLQAASRPDQGVNTDLTVNGNAAFANNINIQNPSTTAGLSIGGSGTLTYTGTVSYNGMCSLDNSVTLILGPGGSLSLAAAGNSELWMNGTSALIINGGLFSSQGWNGDPSSRVNNVTINSGSASFGSTGGGTQSGCLSLNANATISLNGGTLAVQAFTGATSNTIDFNGGTLEAIATNNTYTFIPASSIVSKISAGGAIINTNSLSATIAGILQHDPALGSTADGGLTKVGAGMLTLTGVNTYTGPTTISAGTLNFGNVAALGTGTGTFAGNTALQAGVSGTVANNLSINSGVTGTIDTQANTVTLSGAIGGGGGLTKVGAGTLLLAATNSSTYGGATTISAGVLEATTSAALPNFSSGTISVASGATLAVQANTTTAPNGWTNANIDSLRANANLSFVANPALGIDVVAGDTFTRNTPFATLGLGLTKLGAGTLLLSASNTYTGVTTISAGTLQLGDGTSGDDGSIAGASIVDNSALVYNLFGSQTYNGVISGNGGLVKTGSGMIVLTAQSTFSGTTTVNGGTLALQHNQGNVLNGNGAVTINTGGMLLLEQVNTIGTQTINISGGTLSASTSNFTVAHIGNVNLSGGVWTTDNTVSSYNGWNCQLDGNISVAGASPSVISLKYGIGLDQGTTTFQVNPTGGVGPDLTVACALANGGSANNLLKTGSGSMLLTAANTYSGSTTISAGTLQLGDGTTGHDGSLNSNVTDNSSLVYDSFGTQTAGYAITGTGGLVKLGAGKLVLSVSNGYTGGTTLSAGTLNFGNLTAIGAGAATFAGNATLQAGVAGTLANNLSINSGATGAFDTQANAVTLSGSISGGGALTKVGAGTLLLTASNSYGGATTISSGTLEAATSTALPNISGGTISVANGAVLAVRANTPAAPTGWTDANIGILAGNTNLSFAASAALGIDVVGSDTFSSTTSFGANLSGLAKLDTGTLLLTASNSYGGGTTISGGILQFGPATGTVPSSGSITINSGGALAATGPSPTYANAGAWVTSGQISTASSGALAITVSDSSAVNLATAGLNSLYLGSIGNNTYSGSLTPGSNGYLLGGGGGVLTVSSSPGLSGAVGVTINGRVVLTGVNTYTGPTTLSGGGLQLGNSAALPSTTTLTVSAGTLDLNGNNLTVTNLGNGAAAGVITDTSSGGGTTTLTITKATSPAIADLITDGAGQKVAVTISNNISGLQFTNNNNTFSGGLTLLNGWSTPNWDRLSFGSLVNTGSAGNIISSPFGRGTITIGQVATDYAQMWTTGGNPTILNNIVFNTALGCDVVGGFRVDGTTLTLAGTLTANNAPICLSTQGQGGNGFVILTGELTSSGSNGLWLRAGNGVLTVTMSNTAAAANNYQGNTTVDSPHILVLGAANQIPNGPTAGNVAINGTLKLNGYSNTINGLSGAGTVDEANSGTTSLLTVGGNNATSTFNGNILNSSGTLALTKTGSGTLTLAGSNTYSGMTTVNAGTLAMTSVNALLGTSGLAVNGGGLNLVTAAPKTITLSGASGTALTLGNGVALNLGMYSGGLDQLALPSGASAALGGGTVAINLTQIGTPAAGTYNLISAPGGGLGSGSFTLNALVPGYNTSLINSGGTAEQLSLAGIPTAYWSGAGSTSWSSTANWASNTTGTPLNNSPGTSTDVTFSATGGSNETTALGANQSIKSLTVNDPVAVSITGANTLTIAGTTGTTGITINSGAGAVTIGANVALTGSGNIAVNNAGGLTISGQVSGSNAIVTSGSGLLTLTGNNTTFTGGMTVTGGTVLLQSSNGASPAGHDTLTINSGATVVAAAGAPGNGSYDNQLGIENGNPTVLNIVGGTFLAGNYEHTTAIIMTGGSLGVTAGATQVDGMDMHTSYSVNPTVTTLACSSVATISSKMTINSPMTFNVASGGGSVDLIVSGVIVGGSSLTKTGSGTMRLTQNESYSGATLVNAGALLINGSLNSASAVSVAGSAAFGGNGSAGTVSVAAGGGIQGGYAGAGGLTLASLTFSGSGTVNLTPVVGSYTGVNVTGSNGLTVSGGSNSVTININNALPLAAGSYALLGYSGSIGGTGSSAFVLGATPSAGGVRARTYALTNPANAIDLTVGVDNPIWTGSNSSAWDTTAVNWILLSSGGTTTFLPADAVIFNDSAVSKTVNISGADVAPLSATFSNSAGMYLLGGTNAITGIGSLIKNGAGGLTISNTNTYSGGSTLSAGLLNINSAQALGAGLLTISGGTLGNTSGAAIVNANNNPQVWSGSFAFAGSNDLNLGSGPVTMSNNCTITVGSNNLTVGGPISGALTLGVRGAGTLILSGSNNYANAVYLGSGAVGALKFQGNSVSNFTITGDNNFLVNNGSTLTIQDNASVTLAGDLKLGNGNGTGNVVQTGGTLTINDSGTGRPLTIGEYPGETSTYTMSGGVLNVPNSITYAPWDGAAQFTMSGGTANLKQITIGSTDKNASGGTVSLSGNGVLNIGPGGISNYYGPEAVNLNGGTLGAYASWSSSLSMTIGGPATVNPQGNVIGLSGALSGTGSLTETGSGTLTLGGGNTFSGRTLIGGGTLALANGLALQNSTLDTSGTGMLSFTNLTSGTLGGLQGSGNLALGNTASAGVTLSVGANNANTTFAGALTGSGGSLGKIGAGMLTLTGASSFGGGATVNVGTLQYGVNNALPTSGAVRINNATLDLSAFSGTVGSVTLAGGTITGNTGATLTGSSFAVQNGTIAVNLAGASAVLAKTTTGTVVLSGSNNYGGGTTISNNGILQLGNSAALPVNGALTANGGTLDLAGNSPTVGSFSGIAGVITTSVAGAATLTVNQSATTVFGGTINDGAGQLALYKTGNGTLSLTNANNYSGATTVNAGELYAGMAGALSPSSAITINSGTLDASSGSQAIVSLTMSSSNAVLNLAVGNVLQSSGTATFAGTLNVSNYTGGIAELMTYGSWVGSSTFTTTDVNGSLMTNSSSYSLSYLSGELEIVPKGTPTWSNISGGSWNTSSNWNFGIAPTNGAGAAAIVGAVTTSPVTISLDTAQTLGSLTFASSSSSGYTLTPGVSGSGSLTMASSNTSPAQITVTSGSHMITANVVLSSSLDVTPTSGTLEIDGNISENPPQSGMSLTLNGADTLILGGSNSFTGGTVVESGTLILTNNEALAVGSSLTIGDASAFAGGPTGAGSDSGTVSSGLGAPLAASPSITPVPEPGTLVLVVAGVVAGLATWRRRRNRGN